MYYITNGFSILWTNFKLRPVIPHLVLYMVHNIIKLIAYCSEFKNSFDTHTTIFMSYNL